MSRKRSRLSVPNNSFPLPTTPPSITGAPKPTQTQAPPQVTPQPPTQPQQQQQRTTCQPGDIEWIRNSDLQLLSEGLADNQFPQMGGGNAAASYAEASTIPSLADIEPWWDSPNGTTSFGGSSL